MSGWNKAATLWMPFANFPHISSEPYGKALSIFLIPIQSVQPYLCSFSVFVLLSLALYIQSEDLIQLYLQELSPEKGKTKAVF